MFFLTVNGRNELSKSEMVGTSIFVGLDSDVDGLTVGFESHALNMVALLPVFHASTFFVFSFSPSVASCDKNSSQCN